MVSLIIESENKLIALHMVKANINQLGQYVTTIVLNIYNNKRPDEYNKVK